MTGCHESRSAMDGKEICLTGLLLCWARIGQFYAEVACREAGAVFLDQWMQKTGRNYCAVGFASSRITHHENPMGK